MHKRILVLSSLVLGFVSTFVAQQDPMQTHFIYNKMMFNPGATGIDEGFCATSGYRNQWDKVNGTPNTTFLNVEGNMSRWFPGGLGINICNDAIGFNRQNNVMLNYSYPLDLGGHTLGIGLGVGMINFGMKPTWVAPQTLLDNSLPQGFSSNGLDVNFGLYFKSSGRFYAGLSGTHLNQGVISVKNPTSNLTSSPYQLTRHLYAMGGYKFPAGKNEVDVQMMLRTDLVKYSVDINARYMLGNIGYAGLTYRTSDCIAAMFGVKWNALIIGYSYDVTMNKLSSVSRGSHEILLKYCYYLPVPPVAVTRHVRWL